MSNREVEQIVVQFFRQLQCESFDEEFSGQATASDDDETPLESSEGILERISSNCLIEALIRALWRCDSRFLQELPLARAPPPGQTMERFRLANKIVRCLKGIGIDVEFQTVLYPSHYETRRLLLALFEKMPKDEIKIEPVQLSPLEQLKVRIGRVLFEHLRRTWERRTGPLSDETDNDFVFRIQRFLKSGGDVARLRAHFEAANIDKIEQTTNKNDEKPMIAPAVPPRKPPKPPALAPKPRFLPTTQTVEAKKEEEQKEVDAFASAENEKLRKKLDEKRAELSQLRAKLQLSERETARAESELLGFNTKLEAIGDVERMVELFSDPDASLQKLKKIVADADDRRAALEERFMEMRDVKLSQLESVSGGGDGQTAAVAAVEAEERQQARFQALCEKVENLEAALTSKQQILAKLQKELSKQQKQNVSGGTEKAPKNPRRKYARRILEICANVNRQNDEILKTIASVNALEHECEQLAGTLDRTWTAVDRWLSKLADEDQRMHQAYRLLLRAHEHCANIRGTMDEMGELGRAIDELTDKNELESQRCASVDAQLESLLADLLRIKAENNRLSNQQHPQSVDGEEEEVPES